MKILISGFTPFDRHQENSSEIMARLLGEQDFQGIQLKSLILPVSFKKSFEILRQEIDFFQPDYVICLGLAEKRSVISLEKIAINYIHSKISDNDGVMIQDKFIMNQGPAAYFSQLPLKKWMMIETPFPVEQSLTAGSFVCNYLMYQLLHELQGKKTKGGFIHLPPLNDNKDQIIACLKLFLLHLFDKESINSD
jgi:pyroglutamyl-peptidase